MESVTTYKAAFSVDGAPQIIEIPKRKLVEGEVFIRIEASPINPSDRYMVTGHYGNSSDIVRHPEGTGIGFEASGLVVDAHESAKALIGKKVAFCQNCTADDYTGVWRQYTYHKANAVIPFPDEIDYDTISCNFVNPVTVCGFIDTFQKKGYKAIVHSAACSSLGKMLVKFCKQLEIPLINIVRRKEQVDILKDLGAEYIVDSSSETYFDDLYNLSHELDARCFFDAVGGGDATKTAIDALPNGSTTYIYGLLGGQDLTYNGGLMIFREITISYFWLGPWMNTLTTEEKGKWVGTVVKDLASPDETSIFKSKIVKTFPLDQIEDAIKTAEEVASEGKVLIKPHQE